ncbi:16516_t:CDS:2 [Funneliformis geosporum]|uniref:histidinol-phosphate transaminase n=1 Tax=Funneliformis geosporum TaxID=1117311 RepID=A0A9W4SGH6_9GLOM|nr:6397_t:CDS:2 [Funneliformis geosporum]CAI2169449.1 16516_t:CDS:2 [Funneliformis geosporum]
MSINNKKTFSLESIVRPNILALKPYRCARDDYSSGILLDANENSFGMILPKNEVQLSSHSKGDKEKDDSGIENLHRYPDPNQVNIKERLVKFRGLPGIDYFFLGVGSDECIDLIMRIFCVPGKDKILITPPTYGMYSVCANINDVGIIKINLDVEDGIFQLKTDEILKAVKENEDIKIIFLCSPGNPTGTALSHESIRLILEDKNYNGIVVIDEAYIDFVEEMNQKGSLVKWVTQYPNLVIMQTLSKSFGLAGIRLGISIADPRIIQLMNNTKAPYNINALTSHVACTALSTQNISNMKLIKQQIREEHMKLISSIQKIPGIGKILGGNDANFILVQILDGNNQKVNNDRAYHIYKELAEKNDIVVRYRGNEIGCEGCLRITVGTPKENELLLKKLNELLGTVF